MHNNYYFLKKLTAELDLKLSGSSLSDAFTQNKNELILIFNLEDGQKFIIKAHLQPDFCCLSFPDTFHRAGKNSLDLFEPIIDQQAIKVRVYKNERCFSIDFENGLFLLFKMHGNRSNVLLTDNSEVLYRFNSSLVKDQNLSIQHLDREIDQSYEAFLKAGQNVKTLFPTFGKEIMTELERLNFSNRPAEEKWMLINQLLEQLDNENFTIYRRNNKPTLTLLKVSDESKTFNSAINALNSFFLDYIKWSSVRKLQQEIASQLERSIKQTSNYITKTQKRLDALQQEITPQQLADILMANLHQIKEGSTSVELPNFYQENERIKIKLKRNLSPQKNAEVLYRKGKNRAIEMNKLEDSLKKKRDDLNRLIKNKDQLASITDFKELRDFNKEHNIVTHQSKKEEMNLPFHTFLFQDFQIWVGKNAKANDKLLQQHSFKDDLWLHAKDVAGSHVLIKFKAGKSIPPQVKERAASIAAHYSKRKNDSFAPVIITPRKYVRKRKGDPPGAVVVDKEEEVLIVPPFNPTQQY